MAYQIELSDEDYARLQKVASEKGTPIEALVHEAITLQYAPMKTIGVYFLPTNEQDSPEEEDELERLALLAGQGRPTASEIVIEDRGPR